MIKESEHISTEEKANEILNVIISYARLEFNHKLPIGDQGDVFDAISSGVNMLGEELQENVISLKEKEQLLKEIHHRVKNNMQIISSLLRLQFINENDDRINKLIQDSQNRIYAMALVHEMLYNTKQFKLTNFKEYIQLLTKSIFSSYAPSGHQINLKIDIPSELQLETETIIPLGLMVNEIITNSLKYAFQTMNGEIIVNCKVEGDEYRICVSDNGKGLKRNFDMEEDSNLGMQLVYLLGEQIDAKIEMNNENGLCYSIYLKK